MSQNGVNVMPNGLPGVLVGRFTHSLDPKRRLTIPSGWREQMGLPARPAKGTPGYVFVMPDVHKRCLSLFPPHDVQQRLERLRQRSISDIRAAEFSRRLGAVSEFLPLDVQGRIRIRDKLLAFAGLTEAVVMVGAFTRIELWNPERNPETEDIDLDALAEISEGMDF